MTFEALPHALKPIQTGEGRIDPYWYKWFHNLQGLLGSGVTGTVTLAKLTGGGTNGSLTFKNGILVSKVDPT